jgi:uncharacterized protein involved in tolerance to divalent cations
MTTFYHAVLSRHLISCSTSTGRLTLLEVFNQITLPSIHSIYCWQSHLCSDGELIGSILMH